MAVGAAPRFLLASGSPRRRDLLSGSGIRFEIVRPEVTEAANRTLTIRELTTLNATRKALVVARTHHNAVVLGADTLVALDGLVIGKPGDLDEAHAILRRLSGRRHQVCTAVFICAAAGARSVGFHVFTRVKFRRLNDTEISAYLARIDPLDKAGAYAAQGDGAEIISEIFGSFTNIVGLPMDETVRALRAFGVEPTRTDRAYDTGSRRQISSLLPHGSSKKKA